MDKCYTVTKWDARVKCCLLWGTSRAHQVKSQAAKLWPLLSLTVETGTKWPFPMTMSGHLRPAFGTDALFAADVEQLLHRGLLSLWTHAPTHRYPVRLGPNTKSMDQIYRHAL
jgi:hypothetical protein